MRNNQAAQLNFLDVELLERCNNNCIHCYINLPQNDPVAKEKEISAEEIKSILKEAASLGCRLIRFSGGEPFLREDFEELYLFARRLGLVVVIMTNATLISPRLGRLLARVPPLAKLEVSLYGAKKESYEEVTRRKGSYEEALRGIGILIKNKVPFIIRGVLLSSNLKDIAVFERGVRSLQAVDAVSGYSIFLDLRCRRDDQEKNRSISNLRVTPKEALRFLMRSNKQYKEQKKEFCKRFLAVPSDKIFYCGAGVKEGCIDAYGNFQLCTLLRGPKTVYNLRKGTLTEAVKNFAPGIRKISSRNSLYLTRCARCFLRGLCQQCPAKSYIEHGALDIPVEYLCKAAHIEARALGLLEKNEKAWLLDNWEKRIIMANKADNN